MNGKANRGHSCVKGRFAWGYGINAERCIRLVRKVMAPKNGYEDWEITCLIARPWAIRCTTIILLRSWMRSRA